ncbi:hypothetical protein [Ructibacterium gallinarum]|uniref:Uncharacterized protein n=1 Tax=Ructibacterium gallinarum TaxID=2779355 RepID=A0A9D5M150_9FIRM|nr:hypothetical protein [Ructibacterium gallinarum]MBE5040717.1 hypothetical protein [Ructibacterium gallinarum]
MKGQNALKKMLVFCLAFMMMLSVIPAGMVAVAAESAPVFVENWSVYDAVTNPDGTLIRLGGYGYDDLEDDDVDGRVMYGTPQFAVRRDGGIWTGHDTDTTNDWYIKPVSDGIAARATVDRLPVSLSLDTAFTSIQKLTFTLDMTNSSWPPLGAIRIYTNEDKTSYLEFGMKGWRPAAFVWASDNISSAYVKVVKDGVAVMQAHNANVGEHTSNYSFGGHVVNHFMPNQKVVEWTIITDGERIGWEAFATGKGSSNNGETVAWRVTNNLDGFADRGDTPTTSQSNIPQTYDAANNRFNFDDSAKFNQDFVYNDADYGNLFSNAENYTIEFLAAGYDDVTFKDLSIWGEVLEKSTPIFSENFSVYDASNNVLGDLSSLTSYSCSEDNGSTEGNPNFAIRNDGATWTASLPSPHMRFYVNSAAGGGIAAKAVHANNLLELHSNVKYRGLKKITVKLNLTTSWPALGAVRVYADDTKQNYIEIGLKGFRPAPYVWGNSDEISSAYAQIVKDGVVTEQANNANVGSFVSDKGVTVGGEMLNEFLMYSKEAEITVITDGEKVGWEVYARGTHNNNLGQEVCWRVSNGLTGFDDRSSADMTTQSNVPVTYDGELNRFVIDDSTLLAQDYVYDDTKYDNMFTDAEDYTVSLLTVGDAEVIFEDAAVYADASITPVMIDGVAKQRLRLDRGLLGNTSEFTAVAADYTADGGMQKLQNIQLLTLTTPEWTSEGVVMNIPESGTMRTIFVWDGGLAGNLQPLMKPISVEK